MTTDIRHYGYGSIDFDSYRTAATALRGQARRDAATMRVASVGALVMVGAIGFAVAVLSTTQASREQIVAAGPGSSQPR